MGADVAEDDDSWLDQMHERLQHELDRRQAEVEQHGARRGMAGEGAGEEVEAAAAGGAGGAAGGAAGEPAEAAADYAQEVSGWGGGNGRVTLCMACGSLGPTVLKAICKREYSKFAPPILTNSSPVYSCRPERPRRPLRWTPTPLPRR